MSKVLFKQIISVKRGKSLSGEYYANSGKIIRLTLANFYDNGGFKNSDLNRNIYYVGEINKLDLLKKGELITPLTEQVKGLLGSVARVPESNKYLPCGDIGVIKLLDNKTVNINFLYHLFKIEYIRKQLTRGAQKSKIRHISPDDFYNIEYKFPHIKKQIQIASILDCIDEKIENNKKINDILERQAKLIYDYWFTQFDFPDENGKSYRSSGGKMVWNEQLKREIPKDWEVVPISANADIYQPQTISNAQFDKSYNYYVYGGGGLIGKYHDYNHANSEVIISCRGNCGNIYFTMPSSWITGNAMVVTPSNSNLSKEYLYHFILSYGVSKYISGSVQKQLTRENLSLMPIIIPSQKILNQFTNIIQVLIQKQQNNITENDKLSKLRDWLLPMLMNGQATIKQ